MLAFIGGVPAGYASGGVTLSLSPSAGEFRVGSTLTISILLDTQDETVSRIGGVLTYPPDILQVVNPATGASFASFITSWTKTPLISNFAGTLAFEGAVLPGIKTSGGTVLGITFRVVAPGRAEISIQDVLLERAGEPGANVSFQARSAAYRFVLAPGQGPHIESLTHPDPDAWVANSEATFSWDYPDSDGFSYIFNQEPYTLPEKISRGLSKSFSLPVDHGGVWYMHLIAKRSNGEWSEPAHYTIRVDVSPPTRPLVMVKEKMRGGSREYYVEFSASDALSGIGRYEARIIPTKREGVQTQAFFAEVMPPVQLNNLAPGLYRIDVRAYDNAGNFSEAGQDFTVTERLWQTPLRIGRWSIPRTTPWLVAYGAILMALFAFGGLLREVWRHHRNIRRGLAREAERTEERLKKDLAALQRVGDVAAKSNSPMARAVDALHEAHRAMEAGDKPPEPPIPTS